MAIGLIEASKTVCNELTAGIMMHFIQGKLSTGALQLCASMMAFNRLLS